MSSIWSKKVAFRSFGQLYDPDRQWEGRLHYHHTSDTVTWQAETVDELPKEHHVVTFGDEEWSAVLEAIDELRAEKP